MSTATGQQSLTWRDAYYTLAEHGSEVEIVLTTLAEMLQKHPLDRTNSADYTVDACSDEKPIRVIINLNAPKEDQLAASTPQTQNSFQSQQIISFHLSLAPHGQGLSLEITPSLSGVFQGAASRESFVNIFKATSPEIRVGGGPFVVEIDTRTSGRNKPLELTEKGIATSVDALASLVLFAINHCNKELAPIYNPFDQNFIDKFYERSKRAIAEARQDRSPRALPAPDAPSGGPA